MIKLTKNRIFLTFLTSLFIFLVIFIFRNIFYSIDDNIKSFSIKFKNKIYLSDSSKQFINNELVFVNIDEKTLDRVGFPMPRGEYVPVIKNLSKAEAEVIGFDIIFANKNKLDLDGDNKLAKAIKEAGNVILGGGIIQKNISGQDMIVIEKPLPIFYSGALSFGYYRPEINDKTNRVISFFPNSYIYDNFGKKKNYNHFSIALLKAYYSRIYKRDFINFEESDETGYFLKPNYKIPFSRQNKKDILINFIPKPHLDESKVSRFPSYSFIDVYDGKINPEIFKGKIVLIGSTSKGIKDTFTTVNGIEYGVYVLGNIINTILTKNYLMDFPETLEWLLIFLLLLLSAYFNLSRSGYVLIFSNISISIIFLFIFPILILFYTNYLLGHLFELFLALIFSLAVGNIIKYLMENKNRLKLSKALSEYVSKAIANEILTSSGNINLDGEKKYLSIFFSDIEGFTSISEKLSPEDLVGFLREYLGSMSDIILNKDGFINKYEGDAIMALWGTFNTFENSSRLACDSALEQQKLLLELNKKWKQKGLPEVKIRIGLHFGDAIIGNIGAKGRKLEYTALGDNVNLASRLEGVNKFYGTYLCVSQIIYEKNKENFVFRYLDEIKVKGKEKPVKIYELINYKENVSEEKKNMIDKFEKGVNFYKNRDFASAKEIFLTLSKIKDSPSRVYLDRCNYYIDNIPDKSWDGIWKYDKK